MSARVNKQLPRSKRWWRRLFSAMLWYLLPCLVGCAGLAYIYGALVWHVNPPVVAVEGNSMLPTLHTGEIVFLSPANPNTLKKGDIVAVRVPAQDRTTYSLPANVVHRIVRIEHTKAGLIFITKGDNNPGNDVFTTPPSDVIGRLRYVVPGIGFAFLFIQSPQGEIFFAIVALIGLLYYLYGLFEDRRTVAQNTMQSTVQTMQAVLAEARKIEQRAVTNQAPLSDTPLPMALDHGAAPDLPHAPPVIMSPPTMPVVPETLSSELVIRASEPPSAAATHVPLDSLAKVQNQGKHKEIKGKKKGKKKSKNQNR